jgi:transposase
MIETDKRKAIYFLHQQGLSYRKLARQFGLSRNTIRQIIALKGELPVSDRKDKQQIDPELLRRLYEQCQGRVQRVYEKLTEEEGLAVKYSTLTRILRELGISQARPQRCGRVPDEPGLEMQHDTTVYRLKLGDQWVRVVASCLYLRYSKRRYLKFYRRFNRFRMKCFFHEALGYWGYSARQCIIDNTNLARLSGLGKNAVLCPEMAAFSKQYGFEYKCHALRHANRKAGEERSFFTVETNFLPGRTFLDFDDLNCQALEWATVRMEHRPQTPAHLIPAKAFEHEQAFLIRLLDHLPAPYQVHDRGTDQYGYAAFEGNYYWVPGTGREEVKLLEYSDRIKIYRARECLAEYPLAPDSVKNKSFSPEGLPAPGYRPNNNKKPAQEEEARLRALHARVGLYLDWALNQVVQRHQFVRKLWALSRQMSAALFLQTLERALKYQITSLETIQRIAGLLLRADPGPIPTPAIDPNLQERPAYQEGFLTEHPDLSHYQTPPPPEDE